MPFIPVPEKDKSMWEKPCMSREHNPPGHIVLPPGTHIYECPACGKRVTINVPFVYC